MSNIERTYVKDLKPGKKFLVKGWVEHVRNVGKIKFFLIRDKTGVIQAVSKEEKQFNTILSLGREDCVAVYGMVKKSEAKAGIEIVPEEIKIINKAEAPLPLDFGDKIQSGKEKRFEYRFLDLRNPKIQAIFRVRDVTLTKIREYLEGNGFVEVHTPVIQAAGAEGGATLFPLSYYNKQAFLRQSPQLYKQILMASGLDRAYEIGPAFRAEKFHTTRHVSEFLSLDFEMAWIDSMEDVLKNIEGMVEYMVKGVLKDCKEELNALGVKDLKVPAVPFKKITYTEGVEILNKAGAKFKWGEDMTDVEERVIGEQMTKKGHEWYFVTRFPSKAKPFYIMMNGKESHSYDLIYNGMEIASGGQREHRYDFLVKVIKEKGLKPEDFRFYVDAFRYGMPPHGGMGFGVERMVQQMLKLDNIKEAILFPRTPDTLVP